MKLLQNCIHNSLNYIMFNSTFSMTLVTLNNVEEPILVFQITEMYNNITQEANITLKLVKNTC